MQNRKRKIDYVDPFIATAGVGNAIVGPQMPHGMAKPSPDTVNLHNSGYDYNCDTILGFSHTHLEGAGARGGRGSIMIMPTAGELEVEEQRYASAYTHGEEEARVGCYKVKLQKYNIWAEVAATAHCGLHRYTFKSGETSRVLIDVGHSLGCFNNCVEGHLKMLDDTSLCGYGRYPLEPGDGSMHGGHRTYTVFFHVCFSQPFLGHTLWTGEECLPGEKELDGTKIGAAMEFGAQLTKPVMAKVGISFIDEVQAKENVEKELPGWDFEAAVAGCENAWENILSRVDAKSRDEALLTTFYSALYRTFNQPTEYTEYDRYCVGSSGKRHIRKAQGRRYFSDIWAIWDTFRTTHPMQILLEPEAASDLAQSLVGYAEEGGWLPMAPTCAVGYSQTMIGHNAAAVIADAYAKGHQDFDLAAAYECMKKTATQQHDDPAMKRLGSPDLYSRLGYYPGGDDESSFEDRFSVSLTLELAYADWCTAQMAKAAGKEEDYRFFLNRSQNYRNLFDPECGLMRRKKANGEWAPFQHLDCFHNGFCECSTWEYTFFVPHDIKGLMNLMGGPEVFEKQVDRVFEYKRFNYGNETSVHIPFLYHYCGKPSKGMEVVRNWLPTFFTTDEDGLRGEDDDGAMSAWYAFLYMGLYPVCPGTDIYAITSPAFDSYSMKVPGGKTFTVEAIGNSAQNIYIQSATLNGKPYVKSYLTHEDIVSGGKLVLTMGAQPSDWGTSPESLPPSMTTETPDITVSAIHADEIQSGVPFEACVSLENNGADGAKLVRVMSGSQVCGERVCFLPAGQSGDFSIACVLYGAEKAILNAGCAKTGVCIGNPQLPKLSVTGLSSDREFAVIALPDPYFTVTAQAKNVGSYPAEWSLYPVVDGIEMTDSVFISLKPGEEQTVSFRVRLVDIGTHTVTIFGSEEELLLDVATPTLSKYRTMSHKNALVTCYEADDKLYLYASGSQAGMEYGVVYDSQPVEGDFTAEVTVESEEMTSPYAPAGLVIKNHFDNFDDSDGMVFVGAKSVRGFGAEFDPNDPEGKNGKGVWGYRCPVPPYSFRIEKNGNHFSGYIKEAGLDWDQVLDVTLANAANSQYVGLLNNSCCRDLRKVKFSGLTVLTK